MRIKGCFSVNSLNMRLPSFHPTLGWTERCWSFFNKGTTRVFGLCNLEVTYWEWSPSFRVPLFCPHLAFWSCVKIFLCLHLKEKSIYIKQEAADKIVIYLYTSKWNCFELLFPEVAWSLHWWIFKLYLIIYVNYLCGPLGDFSHLLII